MRNYFYRNAIDNIKTLTFVILGLVTTLAAEFQVENIGTLPFIQKFNVCQGNQKDLNKWVAENGATIYLYINNNPNFNYPEQAETPEYYTLSKDWSVTQGYSENQVDFVKKKSVSASTAIKSLLNSKGRFDCRIAQRIVFMELVRSLMGDKDFDEYNMQFEAERSEDIFASAGQTKMLHLCGGTTLNPYIRFTSQGTRTLYAQSSNAIGYFGYTPNINEYATLHPNGVLRGDHGLLCSGSLGNSEEHYAGFGPFYADGALQWNDLVQLFKIQTLTLSSLEIPSINNASRSNPAYIRQMELLHAQIMQRNKGLIESLQDTYETKLQERQLNFQEPSTSYNIDLEAVKKFLIKL